MIEQETRIRLSDRLAQGTATSDYDVERDSYLETLALFAEPLPEKERKVLEVIFIN